MLHSKLLKLPALLEEVLKAPNVPAAFQGAAEQHLRRLKRDRAQLREDKKEVRLKRRKLRAWSRSLNKTAKCVGQSWNQAWAAEQQAAALLWHAHSAQPAYVPASSSADASRLAAAENKLAEYASDYERLRRTLAWRDSELVAERRKQEELRAQIEAQKLELQRCHSLHRQELIKQDAEHRAERAQLQRRLEAAESRRGPTLSASAAN